MNWLQKSLLLFFVTFSLSAVAASELHHKVMGDTPQIVEFYDGYWWTAPNTVGTCKTARWVQWDKEKWEKSAFKKYAAYTLVYPVCKVISYLSEDEAMVIHGRYIDLEGNIHECEMSIWQHERRHWFEGRVHPY